MGQLEQKETYQLHAKKLRRNKERTMDGNEALVGKPKTFGFFLRFVVLYQTSETRDKNKEIGRENLWNVNRISLQK